MSLINGQPTNDNVCRLCLIDGGYHQKLKDDLHLLEQQNQLLRRLLVGEIDVLAIGPMLVKLNICHYCFDTLPACKCPRCRECLKPDADGIAVAENIWFCQDCYNHKMTECSKCQRLTPYKETSYDNGTLVCQGCLSKTVSCQIL